MCFAVGDVTRNRTCSSPFGTSIRVDPTLSAGGNRPKPTASMVCPALRLNSSSEVGGGRLIQDAIGNASKVVTDVTVVDFPATVGASLPSIRVIGVNAATEFAHIQT